MNRLDDPVLSLVVATGNRGKLAEIRALLAGLPLEVLAVADVVVPPVVVEDAETFAGNALKKARAVAVAAQCLTLADDSGLEVDALGGRPGVRSARYAGETASDADNNAKLLAELAAVPAERRTARFRCALALIDPWSSPADAPEPSSVRAPSSARSPASCRGAEVPLLSAVEHLVDGTLEGRIGTELRGAGGFGYDPLFLVGDGPRTLAELSESEKNGLSHRGQALRSLRPVLERILRERLVEAADAIATRPPV
ncbi:MAG: non-canonical purine NTP pyrophosphatase [Deltaproteobacteria bacterium]|nr:non-canonical purine NTP pyrophosphatase [Deltaproteobacteria bacterium]